MANINDPNWVQYVTMVLAVVLILGGIFYIPSAIGSAMTVALAGISIPTAAEIVAEADIPTAEDIAELIDIPEQYVTGPEVKDTKKEIAWDLAVDEMDTKNFKKKIVEKLRSYWEFQDCNDYKDITKIVAKENDDESEISLHGENANVTVEFNVYYLIDGDDEECAKARMQVTFEVVGLDRSEDYEDAEVIDWSSINIEKIYGTDSDYCVA